MNELNKTSSGFLEQLQGSWGLGASGASMPQFFHVDRGRHLRPGMEITYANASYTSFGESSKRFSAAYSNKVTRFGLRYSEPNIENYHAEHFYEAMRTGHFPHLPGRFQSVFGTKTLEGAIAFAEQHPGGPNTPPPYWIWRVEADAGVELDMGLVNGHVMFPFSYDAALDYWSGQKGTNPMWEVLMTPPVRITELAMEWSPTVAPA